MNVGVPWTRPSDEVPTSDHVVGVDARNELDLRLCGLLARESFAERNHVKNQRLAIAESG